MDYFMRVLRGLCVQHIPRSRIQEYKRSHPWFNQICAQAVRHKNAAEGSSNHEAARIECGRVLQDEHAKYREELKRKIAQLSKSDKRWWQLSREFLGKAARVSSIPPLKQEDGTWTTDPKAKANLFAKTWFQIFNLPLRRERSICICAKHLSNKFLCDSHAPNRKTTEEVAYNKGNWAGWYRGAHSAETRNWSCSSHSNHVQANVVRRSLAAMLAHSSSITDLQA